MKGSAMNERIRPARVNREGSTRTATRTALRSGRFDELDTRMSSRRNRRGFLEV